MKVDKSKWEKKTLGEVCIFKRGLTYPKSEECHVPSSNIVLRSNNIDLDTYSLVFSDLKYLSDTYEIPSEKKIVKDSILMCMSNGSSAHIGKVAFIDREYDCAFGGFMGLIIPHHVFPKYLYYNYRSKSFKDFLLKIGNGINITNLKFSSISPYPILIPNFEIQQSIASELDAIQTMIDGYKAQLDDLDELAKSIFLDMFGDPVTNPKGWEKKNLSSICIKLSTGPFGTMLHKSDYCENGIPSVNPQDIKSNTINFESTAKVSLEKVNELSNYKLKQNDIILARRGDLSKCAVVSKNEDGWLCGTGSFFLKLKDLHPIIFYYQYKSDFIQNYLKEKSLGATMPNLNQKVLNNLPIYIPPIIFQQQFAAKIETIETQKEKYKAQLADAEQLMAERMQYYFS